MNNDSAEEGFEGMHYAAKITGDSDRWLSATIHARAHEPFERRGRHPDHEWDDWLQAIKHHLGV